MAAKTYDVIVVGARCAGSPLAKLLADKGYKVLVVDRATFPSDTISTHLVHPTAVGALERWGVLDELAASGCPPIDTYSYDFGAFVLEGSPAVESSSVAYGPRRIVLDKILVDAASRAGAEVREGFSVDEVLLEDGRVVGVRGHGRDGKQITERAHIVVGADGRHSRVAETVRSETYNEKPVLLAAYYAYWSDLPMDGRVEVYIRPERGFGAIPTHDDLTVIVGGWPMAEFEANKRDIEGNFLKSLDLAPEFAERVRAGKRVTKFAGAAIENYFRKPYGPGWALVGDAGYNKDSITAQGILDAFRDAESLAIALDESLTGARSFDDAMSDYQRIRDAHVLPMYEFTCQLASMEPPPPEVMQLLAATYGNQEATDDFVRMNAGSLSPATFFAPDNIEKIMAATAAA